MPIAFRFAARSDVGRARSKNDDSAYAGRYLAVVADGMGGHVGGDVASASAVIDLTHLDHAEHHGEADTELADEIQNANQNIARLVQANPRLGGMGTTVTSVLIDEDLIRVAHIGDSRAYRWSETQGFSQVTTDHTFVQRLIEEGRLRPEDAENHPHKNVLMRVLGDVDASPEVEVQTLPAQVGERWLLCSDGLDAVVGTRTIEAVLRSTGDLNQIVDSLVELTLDRGAPDNVTVVALQVEEISPGRAATPRPGENLGAVPDESHTSDEQLAVEEPWNTGLDSPVAGAPYAPEPDPSPRTDTAEESSAASLRRGLAERPHLLVGAAASATQTGRIPTVTDSAAQRRATLLRTANPDVPSDPHEVQHALLGEVGHPHHSKRRRALWVGLLVLLALGMLVGGWFAKSWTSSQYYVGENNGKVAVYNGVSQSLGPIELSELDHTTTIEVAGLPSYVQDRVRRTIPVNSLQEAERIVDELSSSGPSAPQPTGRVRVITPTPEPSGTGASSGRSEGGGDSR